MAFSGYERPTALKEPEVILPNRQSIMTKRKDGNLLNIENENVNDPS